MMDPTLLIAFITTTVLFVAAPGPSVAFATAQGLKHGRRGLFITVAGDGLGTIVHIAVAASSLATLLALSDVILPPLQIAGGVFIVWMGLQSFAAMRNGATFRATAANKVTFWAGFFACVSNPKAIVFFVALFPAFISADHSVLVQTLIYGAIFLVLDALSILGYALLTMHTVNRATSRWLNPHVLTGTGLTGVGLTMIVKGYRAMPGT